MMTDFLQAVLALPQRIRPNTSRPNLAIVTRPASTSSRWPAEQVAEWRDYRDRLLANINKAYAADRRFPRWSGIQWEKYGPMGDDQRWLVVKIDMSSLHHTSIPMLINPDLLDWLSKDGVVGRRAGKHIEVIKTDKALLYAIQLKPLPAIAAPQTITLPERIDLPTYDRPAGVLPSVPGITTEGPLVLDLAQPYHIIIGGLTQHGKTALVHALLIGLCRFASPQQLRVAIVDPKGQFVNFNRLPHLFKSIATDERAALKLVSAVIDEIDNEKTGRKAAFAKVGALDIDHYNAKAAQLGFDPLPHMLFIVDEGVELSLTAGKAWMPLLTRIASRAASFGIRLVFISTSTTSDVIDTTFRNLFGIRISVKCTSRMQSTKILGDGINDGADLPNVPGRFAANLPDRGVVIGQGYYLERDDLDREAQAIIEKWQTQADVAPESDAISHDDRDIALYCLTELGGEFISTRIGKRFDLHPRDMKAMGAQWDQHNWLLPSTLGNRGRLSQTIRDLVGWVDPA